MTTNDIQELANIYGRTLGIEVKKRIIRTVYSYCGRDGVALLAHYLISAKVINSKKINEGVRYLYWAGQLNELFKELYNRNQSRRKRKK